MAFYGYPVLQWYLCFRLKAIVRCWKPLVMVLWIYSFIDFGNRIVPTCPYPCRNFEATKEVLSCWICNYHMIFSSGLNC